jgi:predicted transcriptional regulator
LLEDEEAESWDDLPPALKAGIKEAMDEAEQGKLTPHAKVMKEIRKKYPKR